MTVNSSIEAAIGFSMTRLQKGALFAYLFERIDNSKFRLYFEDGIAVKKRIDNSGYILRDCKLYAYATHYSRTYGTAMPKAKDYGIHKDDAALLRRVNLGHIPKKFKPYSLNEFKTIVATFIASAEMDAYIGRYISKCLIFLDRHYDMKRDVMHSRMQEAALYAIYRKYPRFATNLHMLNVAKAAIHNMGQTIRAECTTGSRQRMDRLSDGTFEHRHVPIDAAVVSIAAPESCHKFEEGFTQLVIQTTKMTPRARSFVSIVSGQYDEEFSRHLGENNSEMAERLQFDTYKGKVTRYFGLTEEKVQVFFEKLRKRMSKELTGF